LLCPGEIFGQQAYRLPHIANGRFAGGSFRTTFVIFNATDSKVTINITLFADDGSPFRVNLAGFELSDKFTVSLEAGETRLLQTDGLGTAAAGSAVVTATGTIGISAIFSIFDSQGNFLTEAGVGSSEPLTDFSIPVESTSGFNTGVALFSDTASASVTLRLLDAAGQEAGRTTVNLGPRGHIARFISGAGEFFPQFSGFRGVLAVTSTAPLAAIALRQNSSPLSLTTLPVVSRSSSQVDFNLAQVANGPLEGGTFRTSFLIFNISAARAGITLSLTKDDGSPMTVNIPGTGTGSTFSITLEPGASAFLQTDGSGVLTTGAARVSSNAPIGVSAIFSILDAKGQFVTEAGVGDSPVLPQFSIPVQVTATFGTGAAFFNRADAMVTLTLTLLDRSGAVLGSRTITLNGKSHLARFVSELFPTLLSKTGSSSAAAVQEFQGLLAVSASAPIAAVALRQNASPLSFTTLPVAAGASHGHAAEARPLLRQTVSAVNISGDTTIDTVLLPGFRLFGTIQGPSQATLLSARGEKNTFFVGAINPDTGRYSLVVPADRYRFLLCYEPLPIVPTATVRNAFDDPNPVQVTAHTARDIMLPAVTMFTISGSISGLGSIPSLVSPAVVLSSNDGQVGATLRLAADGSYQGQVPGGAYTATLAGQIEAVSASSTRQVLSIFGIGSASITGSTMANFTVPPTARIAGTIRASAPDTSRATVSAADTSVPPLPLGCAPTASINSVTVSGPMRTYQMTMATGRTYVVQLGFSVTQGEVTVGTLSLPVPPRQVAFNGDSTQDFEFPALPASFSISGRVTDSNGAAVAGVVVAASTSEVTGISGAAYSASAQTAADGTYRLQVLSGNNYQVSFSPPLPRP
jgi:hypothetical protein